MAGRDHNLCGDPVHNLLNRSGLQLIALDGAGAVRYKSQCALSKGIQSYSNVGVVTMHNLETTQCGPVPHIGLQLNCAVPTCEALDPHVVTPSLKNACHQSRATHSIPKPNAASRNIGCYMK